MNKCLCFYRFLQWNGSCRWSSQFPRSVGEIRLQTDHWLPESQFSNQTTESSLQSAGLAGLDCSELVLLQWLLLALVIQKDNPTFSTLWSAGMPEPLFPQDEEVSPLNPFLEEDEASRRDARPLERALDMLMVTTSRRYPRGSLFTCFETFSQKPLVTNML